MDQRRFTLLGVAVLFFAAGPALARTGYRIELANGDTISSADAPVRRGTILTFHRAGTGILTGVPSEEVVAVETDATPLRPRPRTSASAQAAPPNRPLEPGEMLVIGPTGDGAALPAAATSGVATGNAGGSMPYGGGNPALYLGSGNYPNGNGPNGLPTAPSSTDLSQALASTTGANGFPANATASPTTIGPNGTPTLSPGMPGANTAIGPNGTPLAGAAAPVIGPNGTPVLGQPGTPGAGTPALGPNGTPTLARPGAPGSAAPAIGPNGTPVLAPPGSPGAAQPNIGPNGTPNAAPSSGPHA